MKTGLKMCVNTQTPLVQFSGSREKTLEQSEKARPVANISELVEGVDYRFSTGGVTRMVFPLVKRMLSDGFLEDAHWVSLNPSGPETIKVDGMTLHHILLEKERLSSYGNVKETIWGAIHGTGAETTDASNVKDIFWSDDFSEYAYYNRLSTELITKLDKQCDFDLFYVHDFQQLAVGQMLGTLKPKIFRWHIPFDDSMIPEEWREQLSSYFNNYDMIIVSCGKYLDSLKLFGYSGRVRKLYPFVDPRDFSKSSVEKIRDTGLKLGIHEDDKVVLVVARMDPMKGQDRAIIATASIATRFPRLKLVLVGNGSFSGSKQGLGLSKSARWRAELERLAKQVGIEDRVILAGHLVQEELDALYERSAFTMLPSVKEGFGLVAVESWIHHKACLITERAGVAEIIEEGKNGMLVNPDDTKIFSEKMSRLLDDYELTQKLAEEGFETSKICSIEEGLKTETKIISELVD
ncbi:MAG: glycosyltransferase family 4 protein [Nitrososphaerales archaeon]